MLIPSLFEISTHDSQTSGLSCKPHRLSTRHYLSFLFIVIFGTYYYIIIHGNFSHFADMIFMNHLLNEPSFPALKDVFFPPNMKDFYRPFVELSLRLDHFLWFDVASFWHLTNVVLHAVNTSLVYLLSRNLFAQYAENRDAAAFYSALLFGINPLATESVCWVSGRSDLILALFMLLSFALYLVFKRNGSYVYLLLSGILYLAAAMTKETALSIPLLLIAFEFIFKREVSEVSIEEKKKYLASAAYFFLLTAAYFLVFRRAGVNTSLMHLSAGASGLRSVSFFENVLAAFASVGFYVKKIFIPWPINFAIYSIPLIFYASLGLVVLILFITQGRLLSPTFRFFAAWILIIISPAVAVAITHIPWVPWAERYLYVPIIGFSMALGLWFTSVKIRRRIFAVVVFAMVTVLFWATAVQRIYLWADDVRFWEATARQSNFGPVYYHYGLSLLNSGRESEGIEQMEKAIATGFSYYSYLVLSDNALVNGDFEGSEQWLRKAMKEYPKSADLHKYLAANYLARTSKKTESRLFLMKAIDEYIKYTSVQEKDAAAYLKIAQLYRAANLNQRAVRFFEKAIQADTGSPITQTAMKSLEKIRIRQGEGAQ